MPEVNIILRARPSDPKFLKHTDYPLGSIEKFAHKLKIHMQFELTADCILIFFKTLVDLEKILQVLSDNSVESYPNYEPSKDFSTWEFSVVKFANGENRTLLEKFSSGLHVFLGAFGRVEMQGEKVLVDMPLNVDIEKHINISDFSSNSSNLPLKSGKK